jgi:O-antigen/teichoic acid export membrane protein
MARFKTVLRHSGYLFGSKILTRLIFTVFVVFAASRLGPELFGAFAFSFSMVELFSWFGDLGLTRFGVRELVRMPDAERPSLNGQILTLQLSSSAILCIVGLIAIIVWHPAYPKTQLLLMGLVAVLLSGVVNATESALVASEKFFYSAALSFTGRLIFVVGGFAALLAGYSAVAVMAAFLAGMIGESILRILLVVKKLTGFSFSFPLGNLKWMLKGSLPFAAAAAGSVVYSQAGVLALEMLKGDREVGIFSVAYSLFIPFIWVSVVLSKAVFPGFAALYNRDAKAARYNYRQWYRLLVMCGVPLAVSTTFLARPVLSFFPQSYGESADVLIILMWSIPLAFVSALEMNVMQITGREKAAAAALIGAMALTVGLEFILIPLFGINGAAAATVAGALAREALFYREVRRNFFLKVHYISLFVRPLIGGGAMGAAVLLLWFLGPWPATAAGLLVYAVTMLASGGVRPSELKSMARG